MMIHDDVIKWKHFPRYWPFVRGIHRSPENSPHKGQWRGALMFSLICPYYDATVMPVHVFCNSTSDEERNVRPKLALRRVTLAIWDTVRWPLHLGPASVVDCLPGTPLCDSIYVAPLLRLGEWIWTLKGLLSVGADDNSRALFQYKDHLSQVWGFPC